VEQPFEPTVAEVMTPSPTVMRPDDDLADVVALMLDLAIRSVPIVEAGRMVGIVSRRDVLRAVAEHVLTSEDVLAERTAMTSHDRGQS